MADPRRARTRAALVGAASTLLAQGRTAVSIQEITDLAGVGFGSFYNHFDSKDELYEAAVQSALVAHSEFLTATVSGIEDPAERFAASLRLTCGLQRELPELIKVALNEGTRILNLPDGIGPQARADIADGVAQGRFTVGDQDVAFAAVGGALLGALQLLNDQPGADAEAVAVELARGLLGLLGVDVDEAARLAGQPLPALG